MNARCSLAAFSATMKARLRRNQAFTFITSPQVPPRSAWSVSFSPIIDQHMPASPRADADSHRADVHRLNGARRHHYTIYVHSSGQAFCLPS